MSEEEINPQQPQAELPTAEPESVPVTPLELPSEFLSGPAHVGYASNNASEEWERKGDAAPSPVVLFDTDCDYIIFIQEDGTRTPVEFTEAFRRAKQLRDEFRYDDGSSHISVLERKAWLVENVTRCVQKIMAAAGTPVDPKGVDRFLKNMDSDIKLARNRRLSRHR